jgi:hypothetical protein
LLNHKKYREDNIENNNQINITPKWFCKLRYIYYYISKKFYRMINVLSL